MINVQNKNSSHPSHTHLSCSHTHHHFFLNITKPIFPSLPGSLKPPISFKSHHAHIHAHHLHPFISLILIQSNNHTLLLFPRLTKPIFLHFHSPPIRHPSTSHLNPFSYHLSHAHARHHLSSLYVPYYPFLFLTLHSSNRFLITLSSSPPIRNTILSFP